MERYTEYHDGIAVIKDKSKMKEAMGKLALHEDSMDFLESVLLNAQKQQDYKVGNVRKKVFIMNQLKTMFLEITSLDDLFVNDTSNGDFQVCKSCITKSGEPKVYVLGDYSTKAKANMILHMISNVYKNDKFMYQTKYAEQIVFYTDDGDCMFYMPEDSGVV